MILAEDRTTEGLSTKWKNLKLIAHADWSTNPSKRWIAVAIVQPSGNICIRSLDKIGETKNLLDDLAVLRGAEGSALLGFDFPIGIPSAYAQRTGVASFIHTLPCFGKGEWADFYNPAKKIEEISLHRPFYPLTPGDAKRDHLTSSLHLNWNELYRLCEMRHAERRSACPLFWTLGGQQVGKAAIHGWQEILALALADSSNRFSIWPFSGELETLLQPGALVAVETYPTEFYKPLGITFSKRKPGLKSGKRQQADRRANATVLLDWCETLSIDVPKENGALVKDGFGSNASGEDAFDAFVGLVGMVKTLRDWDRKMEPEGRQLRNIEGWIFGQKTDTKVEKIELNERPYH